MINLITGRSVSGPVHEEDNNLLKGKRMDEIEDPTTVLLVEGDHNKLLAALKSIGDSGMPRLLVFPCLTTEDAQHIANDLDVIDIAIFDATANKDEYKAFAASLKMKFPEVTAVMWQAGARTSIGEIVALIAKPLPLPRAVAA